MITILQSIILGIVEGITEFLPISSTGHLIISAKLLNIADSDFLKSFEIIIQLGAILSVLFLYGKKIVTDREYLLKLIVAFIPTGLIGISVYKLIKGYLLGNSTVVAVALLVGGLIMIFVERYFKVKKLPTKDLTKMEFSDAFVIGVVQGISVIPGVSRAAATIIGGLALGFDRKSVVEFSFLLAIPTMLAATGYDFIKSSGSFSSDQLVSLGIGFVVSFFAALIAVKWLLRYVKSHDFTFFGVYRVLLAIFVYFYL